MIVPSMTFAELRKELYTDEPNVLRKYAYIQKDFERFARRQRFFPAAMCQEYTSPRKNRWIIISVAFRRDIHHGGGGMYGCCLQKCERGFALHCLVMTSEKDEYVVTYNPHFFDRYAQRAEVEKTGIDLIKHFLRRNFTCDYDYTKEFSGRNARDGMVIHASYVDGAGLGFFIAENHIVMKTFITYEMATGKQRKTFEGLKVDFDRYAKQHKELWYNDKHQAPAIEELTMESLNEILNG